MHIIHDIAFEVAVNHDDGLVSWEQYYANFIQNKLLPRVERICDDWDKKHPNTKCTIDTIDINVEVSGLNLEELQKEIIQQIRKQIISIQDDGSSVDGKVKAILTREAAPFDALISYLSDGILPAYIPVKIFKEWFKNSSEFTSVEKTKLTALFATAPETIERMLSLLRNDYTAFSALIETKQQITPQSITLEATFFKQFLKAVCNCFQLEYTDENATIWHKTLGTSSSVAQFSKTFIQLLKPKVQAEGKRLTNSNARYVSIALLQAIIQQEQGKEITISTSKIGKISTDTAAAKQKETQNTLIANTKQKRTETSKITDIEATKNTKQKAENGSDQEQYQTDEKGIGNSENEVAKTTESANIQGKTSDVVENKTTNDAASFLAKAKKRNLGDVALTTEKAGLILLHPFLTTFFKGAKLVTETNEINNIEKACMLLHYLATENEEVSDVELTLEKILLGIPIETIVDCEITLTTEDKALCDELLQAILSHWVVLKKSTINTLRDMFLMRDGHITITEESIKLKIERLAQDILLEKVPWNTSLFRLKWMEKMVHIEW